MQWEANEVFFKTGRICSPPVGYESGCGVFNQLKFTSLCILALALGFLAGVSEAGLHVCFIWFLH